MMRAVTLDSDNEEDIAVVMMNRAKTGESERSEEMTWREGHYTVYRLWQQEYRCESLGGE